jgi:hypothetical protein
VTGCSRSSGRWINRASFKVLAAGRNATTPESLRATFRYVVENSKPRDALVVGMFPKQSNQIAENAAIIREVVPRSE